MPKHVISEGTVQVYQRARSRFWQCAVFIDGHNYRASTRQESQALAIEWAKEWARKLRSQAELGLLPKPNGERKVDEDEKPDQGEVTFRDAAKVFLDDYKALTHGRRSGKWTEGHEARIRLHLNPFFGDMGLTKITGGTGLDYRAQRIKTTLEETGKPPAPKTLHNEIVTLNLILKNAERRRWLQFLPNLSDPYSRQSKIEHRAWFEPEEYKTLYEATRENAKNPALERDRWHAEQLHDFVLFLANSGLRPDEAHERNLLHQDIEIIDDPDTNQEILLIAVRGKRGVGYCKTMPGAVQPYRRLLNRPKPLPYQRGSKQLNNSTETPKPTDPVFPHSHLKMFNTILKNAGIKLDRAGKPRTAYSLRHTYICMRLMEGADIYQLAKNCRTSVEMIEKHYAAHIKNRINAAAVNTRRPKRKPGSKGNGNAPQPPSPR